MKSISAPTASTNGAFNTLAIAAGVLALHGRVARGVHGLGAQLVEALGGTLDAAAPGANDVRAANIQDEPGYQLMTNPAWQCDALTRLPVEWLDALA